MGTHRQAANDGRRLLCRHSLNRKCEHHLHHFFFFFNDTPTTEIYPPSLHDALPFSVNNDRLSNPPSRICSTDSVAWPYVGAAGVDASSRFWLRARNRGARTPSLALGESVDAGSTDRKSTRLNSSHSQISYAVFCLKK